MVLPMPIQNYDNQIRLMLLLTNNRALSVDDISSSLHMSKRSIYRYLVSFKEMGFIIKKEGVCYRLDPSSPLFKQIDDRIHFTADEVNFINEMLNMVYVKSPLVNHLRTKLSSLYNVEELSRCGVNRIAAQNISVLSTAMQMERLVKLCKYVSPEDGSVSNLLVEPYQFLSDDTEVRCYNLTSKKNEIIKISNIQKVKLLDALWPFKDLHQPVFVDMFNCSSEKRFPVKLLLDPSFLNSFLKDHPGSENEITLQNDGRYLLTTLVCGCTGVGGFVLANCDHVEVIDTPLVMAYLHEKISNCKRKLL